jgi:DNA-directed RNA polymerase subunit RPC12/RpoP
MRINCPTCHKAVEIKAIKGAKTYKCPKCGGTIVYIKANYTLFKAACKGEKLTENTHEVKLTLYSVGLTDVQMAEKLDMWPASIRHWRKRHGLPPNDKAKANDAAK